MAVNLLQDITAEEIQNALQLSTIVKLKTLIKEMRKRKNSKRNSQLDSPFPTPGLHRPSTHLTVSSTIKEAKQNI